MDLFHKYENCTLFFICLIRCCARVNQKLSHVVRVLYTTGSLSNEDGDADDDGKEQ